MWSIIYPYTKNKHDVFSETKKNYWCCRWLVYWQYLALFLAVYVYRRIRTNIAEYICMYVKNDKRKLRLTHCLHIQMKSCWAHCLQTQNMTQIHAYISMISLEHTQADMQRRRTVSSSLSLYLCMSSFFFRRETLCLSWSCGLKNGCIHKIAIIVRSFSFSNTSIARHIQIFSV